jgi:hypothetical protein
MHFNLDHAPLSLTEGALLKISDGRGRSLRVLEGRVWITQEGSLDDSFLDAGESYTFEGSGSAVVTAEGSRNAKATVLFDVPLTIQSRPRAESRWFGFLGSSWNSAASA